MTTSTLRPAADYLADPNRTLATIGQASADHFAEAERLQATGRAADDRRASWHVRQCAALNAAADGMVDYDSVLERGEPRVPYQGRSPQARSDTYRAAETALAEHVRSGLLPDGGAELITRLMESGTTTSRTAAQRWAAAASDPAYLSAFSKVALDPQGHLEFDANELRAFRAAREVQREMRDLSEGVPSAGGLLVPSPLDPAVILSSAGVISPVRDVARVVTLSQGSTWTGITSDGVTSEWKPELQEVAEVAPTFVAPTIPVFMLSTYVEFSYEVAMDGLQFLESLQRILVDSANTKLENAYATGSSVGEPQGIITAAVANAQTVAPLVAETLGSGDVYRLQEALSPRWQPTASWLSSLSIINDVAQMETTNGARLFPEIASGSLLRRPLHEWSLLDDSPDATATATNYVMAYGSWRNAYACVDRIGASLDIVQTVLGANRRPIGARGAHLWMRHGGGAVVPSAAKLLSIPTAA